MDKWPIDSDDSDDRQAHEHAVALEERLAYSVTFWNTDEVERIADYAARLAIAEELADSDIGRARAYTDATSEQKQRGYYNGRRQNTH